MNSQDYFNWLQKFEKRTTSDDTFTPPAVYDVVLNYVDKHIIKLDGLTVVRPFYPDGDYQQEAKSYDDKTIVIDNPPFSIIGKIAKFYHEKGVKFFLFAPALTTFQSLRSLPISVVACGGMVTYDNGAKVNTSFITNLLDVRVKTAPELCQALMTIEKASKRVLPIYQYPPNVLMVSDLTKLAKAGVNYEVGFNDSVFIAGLDEQKQHGKKLFGSGLLISHAKAKELSDIQIKTQKDMIYWQLSDNEKAIVEKLGQKND